MNADDASHAFTSTLSGLVDGGVVARTGDRGDSMPDTTWYEILGNSDPKILPQLVSSETNYFVVHPNGRKSAKMNSGGLAWHKTFEAAKVEVLRRINAKIATLNTRIEQQQKMLDTAMALMEDTCSKNS